MANTRSRSLGPALTTAEQVAGFCYLPFFVFLLSWSLEHLTALLGFSLTELEHNVVWFILNCAIVWVIFHRFLLRSFRAIRFWELVQALILGGCLYYAGNFLFDRLMGLLGLQITGFNDITVRELTAANRWAMILCTVLLAPITEETLVRGLLFGVIRPTSRIAAYVVTILFFAAIHVWSYLLTEDLTAVLLAALRYIPAGIALGWTYEKADTVWAPIFLHMLINAVSMGLLPAA